MKNSPQPYFSNIIRKNPSIPLKPLAYDTKGGKNPDEKMDEKNYRCSKKRRALLGKRSHFNGSLRCIFRIRLADWQIVHGEEYLEQANKTSVFSVSLDAARGEILDVNGEPLAVNQTAVIKWSLKKRT